jgi:hypothetical protein
LKNHLDEVFPEVMVNARGDQLLGLRIGHHHGFVDELDQIDIAKIKAGASQRGD